MIFRHNRPTTLLLYLVVAAFWAQCAALTSTTGLLQACVGSDFTLLSASVSEGIATFGRNGTILKLFRSNSNGDDRVDIGRREYAALGLLQRSAARSHLAPRPLAFEVGACAGRPTAFLQMAAVPGRPFKDAFAALPSMTDMTTVAHSLLNMLDVLKSVGLTHRDVDGTNVLLSPDTLKLHLLDFSHAVWDGMPATSPLPAFLGRYRTFDRLSCGYDDGYSVGRMVSESLWQAEHIVVSLGLQQLVYHMARLNCEDRIRNTAQLRSILNQYGLADTAAGPVPDSAAAGEAGHGTAAGLAHIVQYPCLGRDSSAQPWAIDSTPQPAGCMRVTGPYTFTLCKPGGAAAAAAADGRLSAGAGAGAVQLTAYGEVLWARAAIGLLSPILRTGAKVVDMGGQAGLYSVLALIHGATGVNILDKQPSAIATGQALATALDLPIVYESRITSGDVVIASTPGLAFISCFYTLGSIQEVVAHLARLTTRYLVVEWTEPGWDNSLTSGRAGFIGHLDQSHPLYHLSSLRAALRTHFAAFACVASSKPEDGRFMYVAAVTAEDAKAVGLGELPTECR